MGPEQGPDHLKFGGGVTESVFSPVVLLLVLIACAFICFGPRRKALTAFLIASILVPIDQIVVVGALHFPMLRILALFGLMRMAYETVTSRTPVFSGGLNRIDSAMILGATFTAIDGVLLYQQVGAIINQLGVLYTAFGLYFLLRYLVREKEDAEHLIRVLAFVAVIVAAVMATEHLTGHNPIYQMFGGSRASMYSSVVERDGKLRATGSFSHPLLAGTFGAILAPLFVALWCWNKKNRSVAVVGIVASTVITLASNSSTPVLAYCAGILGLCFWPMRNFMRPIRWAIVLTLVTLHLSMKAPVWHLISRIDLTGSSSGYHRYMLVDQFIRRFSEWWLFGVKDTSHWGWDMWDTANQYVSVGENSGVLPFLFLLATIVYAFKRLGKARVAAGERGDKRSELFLWCLGATLFANVVGFFGISFWDQTAVEWYAILATITAAAPYVPRDQVSVTTLPSTGFNLAQSFVPEPDPIASLRNQ